MNDLVLSRKGHSWRWSGSSVIWVMSSLAGMRPPDNCSISQQHVPTAQHKSVLASRGSKNVSKVRSCPSARHQQRDHHEQEEMSWSCKLQWIALFWLLKRPKNLEMRENAERWAKKDAKASLGHQDHIRAFIIYGFRIVFFRGRFFNQKMVSVFSLVCVVWGMSRKCLTL